jgi:uncharacterized protein
MRHLGASVAGLLMLSLVSFAAFALDFPPLSGRVVDQAGILTDTVRNAIAAKSKALEDRSTDQLVVATVSSLQNNSIEMYANGLFRSWRLGQAGKNNGVLLLVAPNERKVRIEVGYGLENTLADDLCARILREIVLPRFRAQDFAGGIAGGVDGIIDVLEAGGSQSSSQPK